MALVGYDVLIIIAVLLVVFLWGPQKLPELARSIGLAKKEFDKATKEVSSVTNLSTSTTPTLSSDPLITAAQSLGISTEGKTKEQIGKEIAEKTSKK